MKHFVLTFIICTLVACTMNDQEAASEITPSVYQVISGGYWETGDNRGRYRAVIVNEGFEHVRSSLWLEWISEFAEVGREEILARVHVVELSQGNWSIRIVNTNEAFISDRLDVRGTNPYSLEERDFVIRLSEPGIYVVSSTTTAPPP